ncbi:MAG: NADPH-dependent F420 reductase, partial [Solirubrobacteraceae bacterium]
GPAACGGSPIYSAVVPDHAPVCIIGASGALGFGLAVRLGRTGMPVAIGSRDAERAAETVERARVAVPAGSFAGYANAVAVAQAQTVILSVPFRNQSETLTNLRGALRPGQLLIDASVPLAAAVSGKATRMLGVWQGSAAQQAREMAPEGVRVVSALHTVSAASLSDLQHELAEDVLVCGDARADKREAAALLERIEGLRCVDCGRLEMARVTESLTALLIAVNSRYKVHAGIHMTGLPEELWE